MDFPKEYLGKVNVKCNSCAYHSCLKCFNKYENFSYDINSCLNRNFLHKQLVVCVDNFSRSNTKKNEHTVRKKS